MKIPFSCYIDNEHWLYLVDDDLSFDDSLCTENERLRGIPIPRLYEFNVWHDTDGDKPNWNTNKPSIKIFDKDGIIP